MKTTSIVLKNILTLLGLVAVLPFNAALVVVALLWRAVDSRQPKRDRIAESDAKNVLISGGKMTKALLLARSFHAAGHRVVLVESDAYAFTGHRFSRAVDRFYAIPRCDSPEYVPALLDIIQRERIDAYVPVCSPAASFYDARARPVLTEYCDVLHVDADTVRLLDDKYEFFQTAKRLGLPVPQSYRITDPAEVMRFDFSGERRKYILKSIAYDAVRRLDLTKLPAANREATAAFVETLPISEANPWILQEFIPGTEYCTHGMVRDGDLRVHCCCESSAFQTNYAHIEKPAIEAWVRRFAAGVGFTGQASFDFIEAADDGRVYAIECNPRTHSAITLFAQHPKLAAAYLERGASGEPIRPLPSKRPTYWIYHELWRLLTHLHSWRATSQRVRTIAAGRDAVFDWRDPLPFLMLHHWHVPRLLLRDLRERRGWLRIDFNIGKLVQAGGD